MVSALDFRSEGWWFDAQSLPSCCFLTQDTLPHIRLSPPGWINGYRHMLLGVTLRWTSIPSRGEKQYSQLLHATETGISSARRSLLGSCAALPYLYTNLDITDPVTDDTPRGEEGYSFIWPKRKNRFLIIQTEMNFKKSNLESVVTGGFEPPLKGL